MLDHPYLIAGQLVQMSPSIGIAIGLPGLDEADDVLRRADAAMYQTKAGRRPLHRK